jgi:hypothetical protein
VSTSCTDGSCAVGSSWSPRCAPSTSPQRPVGSACSDKATAPHCASGGLRSRHCHRHGHRHRVCKYGKPYLLHPSVISFVYRSVRHTTTTTTTTTTATTTTTTTTKLPTTIQPAVQAPFAPFAPFALLHSWHSRTLDTLAPFAPLHATGDIIRFLYAADSTTRSTPAGSRTSVVRGKGSLRALPLPSACQASTLVIRCPRYCLSHTPATRGKP